ncbi:MAG: methylated-DNA--[protein]-cysteine S-methyltransferase [Actinomycetota bacterium]
MTGTGGLAQRSLRTTVGVLRVTADDIGIVAIERVKQLVTITGSAKANRHAERTVCQLREYFAGMRRRFDVPLHLEGTDFQERAWAAMRKIPFGSTISYAQQAKQIGKPRATRAVGTANGANPVPIIVPCHRVIASDGSLGGYALGLAMKRKLLALEGAN